MNSYFPEALGRDYYYTSKDDDVYNQNLALLHKVADHNGEDNVLSLGSVSGHWSGRLDDFSVLPFKGTGLRILFVAKKGDGKSVLQSSLFEQLNAFYGYPVIVNDLKHDFVTPEMNRPIRNPVIAGNLRKMGFEPMGMPNVDMVVPSEFWQDENHKGKAAKWRIELRDLKKISDRFDRKNFLMNLLGMDVQTASSQDKYSSAEDWIEQVMIEYPDLDSFDEFYKALEHVYADFEAGKDSGSGKQRGNRSSSYSLVRKIKTAVMRAYSYGGIGYDFLKPLKEKRIVSIQGSVGSGAKDKTAQSYFCFPFFLVKEWRERNWIPKVVNVFEERDAVVGNSDASLLARLLQLDATKGRYLSNISIHTIQDPSSINRSEVQQFDYLFTTRPNNDKTFDLLEWLNGSEACRNTARYLTKSGGVNQWLWASASEFGTFFPQGPLAGLREETTERKLQDLAHKAFAPDFHATTW